MPLNYSVFLGGGGEDANHSSKCSAVEGLFWT